ncbi:actin cytoskeleton-regulatory complex protein pan-1-like [Panicum miliaceum]|uniref:Actin cytoskeleton-regulatory complex protein pan-1-like n=1 Tax=Panicum miliaceum TaxID=4540 RepID=A0A3L6PCY4_PANMI|nr:actin cytoskeleton-regulatory complex protein pan-1-like [Panicum miliaceum]
MQSGEQAPEPAAVREAVAPAVVVPPGPTALVGDEAAELSGVPVRESAAAEASKVQEAEASPPVDGGGGGKCPSPSPAPASPSTVKERQIPVDPASLRRLGMVADEDSPLSAPSVLTEVVARSSPLLPPLRRPTFVGASLPCSAASSPVHGAGGAKWEEQQQPAAAHSPTSALRSLARQHSAALARLVAAPSTLPRSASRAEGRTMGPHDDEEPGEPDKLLAVEDGFTCGALCMLIPGFSRKKPAFAASAAGTAVSGMQRQPSGLRPRRSSASRVASLERFECGSWSPPPPPPPPPVAARHEAADCLATEVAKTSCANADDAEAPVKMAFVFDGDPPAATRGILKNSPSSRLDSARPSTSSQRHVRFSTAVAADAAASASCPTSPCITPRLARARAEFNAFLEAQSA